MNSQQIKEFARAHGADLVGVASADRFREQAEDVSPFSIFPQFKSIIVIGRRILRGSLRGIEEGTNFGSTYGSFGLGGLNDNYLCRTVYEATCFVEENGFEAVPLFAYEKQGMAKGVPVREGKPVPNVIVDFAFAAQAAGLGSVGLGGFFLTPEYGTRQRFQLILTDAELEPDEPFTGSVCDSCGACVEACPFGAISVEDGCAKIDYKTCGKCPNGAFLSPGTGEVPDRIAAACGRACLVHLEENGLCESKFDNKFRKRTPWALDLANRPIEATQKEA